MKDKDSKILEETYNEITEAKTLQGIEGESGQPYSPEHANDPEARKKFYAGVEKKKAASGQKVFVVMREVQYEGSYLMGVFTDYKAAKTLKEQETDPTDMVGDNEIYHIPINVNIYDDLLDKYRID